MMNNNMTIKEATERWVSSFNAIPQSLIVKAYLKNDDIDSIQEITPITDGNLVWSNEYQTEAEVLSVDRENETARIDVNEDEDVEVSIHDLNREDDDYLPMWGTMWTFGSTMEDYWIEEQGGLEVMADCGFRIYETDELGYLFGIDGAGYSFYEDHWIPLYKARGLKWHREE